MYEIIGIMASLFVLTSFVFRGEATIRKINIIGASLFVIYGLLIGALSVWLLNGTLIAIHIHYLSKMNKSTES